MKSEPSPSSPLPLHRGRRSVLRRIIPPLLVLLVAGGLYFYGQHQRQQRAADVAVAAQQLCKQVSEMPRGGALPPIARELDASLTTIEQLQSVLAVDPTLQSLLISVMTGDAEAPYGDGSATHQAHISIHGRTAIALRFLHNGDPQQLRLIGYWTP